MSEQKEFQAPTQNSKLNTQRYSLMGLLVLYVAVALAHAYLAPLTTGPDELAHYEYARFIADHGRLPLNRDERGQASYKSDQPPLYHLITALPTAFFDSTGPPVLKRVADHERRQLIERTRHAWGLYNTEDELWPYRGEVLRWHIGRWVAILFGAATVAVTYFIAHRLFVDPAVPERNEAGWLAALGAAAIVAFIPRFALTGSMLNYETTVAFFAALFLWTLVRMAPQHGEWRIVNSEGRTSESARRRRADDAEQEIGRTRPTLYVLSGLFAGLAITAKLSALILPLEMLAALWLIGRYRGWGWSLWWRRALAALAAAGAAVSWWFGFILYRFNTVAQDGWWVGLLRPLIAADASDATTNRLLSVLTGGQAGFTGAIENLDSGPPWEWAAVFFRTFWIVGIETVQPLAPVAPALALAGCLLAAVGLFAMWRTRQSYLPVAGVRLVLALLGLHLVAPIILPVLRYAATASLADTAQGRHLLFLAAPALAILWVWGLGELVLGSEERRARRRVSESADGEWRTRRASVANGEEEAGPDADNTQLEIPEARQAVRDMKSLRGTQHASSFPLSASRFALLLPGLFLLVWSGVQLWTMTWAYLSPLPVSTVPAARAQAEQQLNRPLNDFVTLVGYKSEREEEGRLLRLDLVWQATAVSPVDYLTEVSLLDEQGQVQAQWLGYSANGRYPTRAWDVGDIIRDTVWLPVAGLEPGRYRLTLNLISTDLSEPLEEAPQPLARPLTLAEVTLQDIPLRQFNGSLPLTDLAQAAAGYSLWRNGEALTEPQTFRYRETVLVTLSPLLPDQQRLVRLIGPPPYPASGNQTGIDEPQIFAPVRELADEILFIVGPDWSEGNYRLQVTVLEDDGSDEQQVNSAVVLRVVDRWQRQFIDPPMTHRLEANFIGQVMLSGYDLGANRAQPGGGIPVTLYWQALDWMGQDYTIFTKLVAADQTVHGGRDRLPQEGYRTLYWAPGEVVVDPFGVPVDRDAPEGIYYINVGLYSQVGQQAVSLPLVQDGQPIDATSVNIGPVKIGRTPPGLTAETAEPEVVLNQPFGEAPNLTLLGYDLALAPGDEQRSAQFELTLYWRSEAVLPVDYTTFVHVRNAAGETVAQQDEPPLDGRYPTSLWEPGEVVADNIVGTLPSDLPAGEYQLITGLYDLHTGLRLPTPGNPENSLLLQSVEVRP